MTAQSHLHYAHALPLIATPVDREPSTSVESIGLRTSVSLHGAHEESGVIADLLPRY